ncbi:glucosaminidase domain-containing protein [Bacillus taeanensis]|uniref:Glucosaminidase n=1 Tax=Bacillus taeanensis TaxID=273032 RepID=A0A366XWF7_9BACI|nr:glucosaminidase domain-containing protein [Bacillus taeanensis]RBW68474.1 glucosaminidase [Bacillus taeanensis]
MNKIMGKTEASLEQMVQFLKEKAPAAPENIAQYYYVIGELEEVRADVALAQALHETGYFRYGGDVKPEQNNFCGLGATGGGNPGHSFNSVLEGVLAQIQHLKGYAAAEPPITKLIDPRYKYINPLGKAPHVEELAGKWAVPGYSRSKYNSLEEAMKAEDAYGHQIMKKVELIKQIKVDKKSNTK